MILLIIFSIVLVYTFVLLSVLCLLKAAKYADETFARITIKKSATSGLKNSV